MDTNKQNNKQTDTVETSTKLIASYSFDFGTLNFTVDRTKIRAALKENPELIDAMTDIAIKTWIHKTKERPENNTDGTDWLLSELRGGEVSGRYRVTVVERESAAAALKLHAMAPEVTEKDFLEEHGVPFTKDLEALHKIYLARRIRDEEAAKAKAKKRKI